MLKTWVVCECFAEAGRHQCCRHSGLELAWPLRQARGERHSHSCPDGWLPQVAPERNRDRGRDRQRSRRTQGRTLAHRFPCCVLLRQISQTEGKELPTLTEVQGDVSGYRERLFEFVESQGVELNYSERIAPAKGLSHGGKITLLSGMKPAEEFSTLVHEIAHLC